MQVSQKADPGYFAPWSLMAPVPPREQAFSDQLKTAGSSQEDAEKGPKPVNGDETMFGEDGFTFADFVDVINPLQHIPLVSQAYRAITGDEISPGARLAGGTLFGGPIGLAGAIVTNAVEDHSGRSMEENVLALFSDEKEGPSPTQPSDSLNQVATAGEKDTQPSAQSSAQPSAEELAALDLAMQGRVILAGQSPVLSQSPPRQSAQAIPDLDPRIAERLNALATSSGQPVNPAHLQRPGSRSQSTNAASAVIGTSGAATQNPHAVNPGSVDLNRLVPKPVPIQTVPNVAPTNPTAQQEQSSGPAPVQNLTQSPPRKLSDDVARQLARIAERNRALEQERLSRQTRVSSPPENQIRALQQRQQQAAQLMAQEKVTPSTVSAKPATAAPANPREIPDYVPKPVPLQQVPDAMKAALEKYQAMLKKQS